MFNLEEPTTWHMLLPLTVAVVFIVRKPKLLIGTSVSRYFLIVVCMWAALILTPWTVSLVTIRMIGFLIMCALAVFIGADIVLSIMLRMKRIMASTKCGQKKMTPYLQ